MQCLGYYFLTYIRAVGIRGVNEIDTQFHSAAQDAYGLRPIRWFSPDSFARNSHRAVSETGNRQLAGYPKFPPGLRVSCLVLIDCSVHMGAVLLVKSFGNLPATSILFPLVQGRQVVSGIPSQQRNAACGGSRLVHA
jgi:hypothetical protein